MFSKRAFLLSGKEEIGTFGGSDKKRAVSGYRLRGRRPYVANHDLRHSKPIKNANAGHPTKPKP
jgi:hypothetical protein